MPRPSLKDLRWFAFCFGTVFTAIAVLQYFFVTGISRESIKAELSQKARNIAEMTSHNGKIDPVDLNRVDFTGTGDFVVILHDGAILGIHVGSRRLLPNLLANVHCPLLSAAAFSAPQKTEYQTDTILPEVWTIAAKKVDGGVVIVGFSETQAGVTADQLWSNLAHFGDTLNAAARVNRDKTDNWLNFAVLSDAGELVTGARRLPLRTDPMSVGRLQNTEHEISVNNKTYWASFSSLPNVAGQPSRMILQLEDITLEKAALAAQTYFAVIISILSFTAFFLLAMFYAARQEGDKRTLREAFRRYFSPQIVETILRAPDELKRGGDRREVTVLFSDIRSFTGLNEALPPQHLSRMLNEYFDAMTDEIFATEGVVDKYVGDALMAFWGAPIEQPDQADRAVRTAIAMAHRLKTLQEKWRFEGMAGSIDAGIGINLGIATVGNLGSRNRFDFTVVGDTVNAASRIEQLNKEYQSHILISESTKAQLTIQVPLKDLGIVPLRGSQRPMRLYEVRIDAGDRELRTDAGQPAEWAVKAMSTDERRIQGARRSGSKIES